MSPELFDPNVQGDHRTKCSDCYALGMVIYEVIGGRVPFYQHESFIVPLMVFQGHRPERPEGPEGIWFNDGVWAVPERCWAHQPNNHPGIEEVLQCLGEASRTWTLPSPHTVASTSTDLPAWVPLDISTEQSTVRGDMYSPSQAAPSQPPERLLQKGDADDSGLYPSTHEI